MSMKPEGTLALDARARVAVIAPSSTFPLRDFERGLAWLRERYTVHDDARWHVREGFLAGDDDTRAAAMLDALRDPEVRCLYAARGGYGCTRLLEGHGDALAAALRRDPKPLVGYSDVTALHALWARVGVRSVHGAMVTALGRNQGHPDMIAAVLKGERPPAWRGLVALHTGAVLEGRALGGNLAVLSALAGTPWQLALAGAVLMLEDIREAPYRVDRMLTTLRNSGALRGVAAVVLGSFTACEPGPDGTTVREVCRERLGDLGVPVLWGAPFGHGDENLPWVSGAVVRVDAQRGEVTPLVGL
jgi:muramoyltetrapeptide carboxypeptidase